MRKRQGSKSQQQEKQQQLFPSPINTLLHYQARREGWEEDLGRAEGGEAATCVAEIKAMRWCQTPTTSLTPLGSLKL